MTEEQKESLAIVRELIVEQTKTARTAIRGAWPARSDEPHLLEVQRILLSVFDALVEAEGHANNLLWVGDPLPENL